MGTVSQSGLRLIFAADREMVGATESFIYLAGRDEQTLCLALWSRKAGGAIGYAVLERAGEEEGPQGVTIGLYELTQLLAAGSPCPGPVVALSGVLWNRREVLAQIEAGDASLPWEAAPRLNETRLAALATLRGT